MRYLLHFCVLWFAVVPPLPAQDSGIDQGSELLIVPAGDKFLRWNGHPGRIFFLQASSAAEPLAKWSWFPYIEYGTGVEISHVVDGSPSRGFFRLQYTDAVPPPGVSLEDFDADGDGISNIDEITNHDHPTNPLLVDTDGDLADDAWELAHNYDPNDPLDNPIARGDADMDGMRDAWEAAFAARLLAFKPAAEWGEFGAQLLAGDLDPATGHVGQEFIPLAEDPVASLVKAVKICSV